MVGLVCTCPYTQITVNRYGVSGIPIKKIIKKNSAYTYMALERLAFFDINAYIAPGTTYAKWYGVPL